MLLMKIRCGFVSNSSSSSFIVIFPTEPKSVEDVKNILFNKEDIYFEGYTIDQVSKTVWDDICDQTKNNYSLIKYELGLGTLNIDGEPNYSDFSHITDLSQKIKVYRQANIKFTDKVMTNFFNMRKIKLKEIVNENVEESTYIFSYADEDGSYGAALEHGDLFSKLKHIRINKH